MSKLEPVRLMSASGQLGYGVLKPAFERGLAHEPHMIGADMGSVDPGPAYLGMGKLIFDSIMGNDFNLALVGLLFATLITLLANLAADLAYAWLDPRISYDTLGRKR